MRVHRRVLDVARPSALWHGSTLNADDLTRIYCVADDPSDVAMLEDLLESTRFAVSHTTLDDLVRHLDRGERAAAILVVCHRPAYRGVALLRALQDRPSRPPVIVLAGDASVDHAVYCIRAGAADYLPQPVQVDALAQALDLVCIENSGELAHHSGAAETDRNGALGRIAGRSRAMEDVRRLVTLVAPTDAAVLIEGESGTGKELVARALHAGSRRAARPFITINCAAMPEGLIESTLFGHEKGAFTGASARTPGVFESAEGGTLFLDEVSEMRLDLQAKMLRVLQESEYQRVGGREVLRADVRVVASSNRRLLAEVEAGRFRADLYYRLHVLPIETPPLRERLEDIPDLLDACLPAICTRLGLAVPTLPPEVIAGLQRHTWPGNIRELLNATQRAVILSMGAPLTLAVFRIPAQAAPSEPQEPVPDILPLNLAELEWMAIHRALEETSGHRGQAARLLGISERTLRTRLNTPTEALPAPARMAG